MTDALHTCTINHISGGKNTVPIQDWWFVQTGGSQERQRQSMMLPDGWLKGLHIVLQERGFWLSGCKYLAQCLILGDRPGTTNLNPACKYSSNASCYAHSLLFFQPDFKAHKGESQETIEAAGYLVIFYPIYYCELNFIEYFWGWSKMYARSHCNYTFPGLVRVISKALEHVSNQ